MANPYSAPEMGMSREEAENPYSAPEMGMSREEIEEEKALEEKALETEYAKYQDPRVYEDTATPKEHRDVAKIALESPIWRPIGELIKEYTLGKGGETGLTAATDLYGMGVNQETLAGGFALGGEGVGYKLAGKKGIAPGALAGSAVGSYVFDSVDAALKALQGDPEIELMPDLERAIRPTVEAAGSIKDEAVNQITGRAIRSAFSGIKKTFSRFLGTDNPRVAELASLAAQHRVPLGIVQAVSPEHWIKGFTRVLGVLPYVSTPFKRSAKAIEEKLGRNLWEMMDSFSPNIHAASTVSETIVNRADEAFDLFHARADQLYNRWFDMAKHLPADMQAFIPTKRLKESAKRIVDQFNDDAAGTTELRDNPIVTWAKNALTFESKLTPGQFKAQAEALHKVMKEAAKENLDIKGGNSIKLAMEGDLNSPVLNFIGSYKNGVKLAAGVVDPDAVSGKLLAKTFKRANTFFEKGIKRFETTTAKKFRTVDKGVFSASFKEAGSQEKDQIFRKLFSMDSPQGIQHLQQLVGKTKVLSGLRTVVNEAMERARQDMSEGLPGSKALDNIQKSLGIGTKNGELVLAQALKGSRTNVDELRHLFEMIKANDSVFNPKTSAFLQRRLTLAGPSAFLPGAAAGGYVSRLGGTALGHAIGVVTGITLLRKGAKYLTNPKNLQTMVRALDDSLGAQVRRNALARIINDNDSDLATLLEEGARLGYSVATEEEPEVTEPGIVTRAKEAQKDASRIVGGLSQSAIDKINAALAD